MTDDDARPVPDALELTQLPTLQGARMVMGFSGWMDGGDVSTGTVAHLIRSLDARPFGRIAPDDFYLYGVPGPMEVAAMFRPHVKITDGLIVDYRPPASTFYVCEDASLVLFTGREPNMRWEQYARCVLAVADQLNVEMIYFVGSVSGLVPHTREPRLYCSLSDADFKPTMEQLGMRFTSYEGPSSLVTYLLRECGHRGTPMVTLVAEIPAYIQGINPHCIESVVRRLAAMLNLDMPMDDLRQARDIFDEKLSKVLADKDELPELIAKLESDYDSEVFDTQMGDLKQWLTERGVRPD